MPFFQIQNHEVSIKDDSADVAHAIIGDSARSFNGKPLSTRRGIYHDWSATTTLMEPAEAEFLIALLQGQGHTWNFDGTDVNDAYLYSSKGLKADVTGAVYEQETGANIKFGDGALHLDAGDTITYDVGYEFEWTVMVWRGSGAAPDDHYIVNSQGQKWVNGVRDDAAFTGFISMSSQGVLTLGSAISVADQYFDDLVVIEADITDAWAEDFGQMLIAFGPMPKIIVRGDMVQNNRYVVEGMDVKVKYYQGYVGGDWYPDLQEIEFTIHEFNRQA